MIGYIVITRRRWDSKPEIACNSVSESAAEEHAQALYHDLQLDMVLVAEINRDACAEEGTRMRKVMKIERTCKHPNIQGDLFYEGKMVCMGCGMVFNPPRKVCSIIEQTTESVGVA